jgi:hypothetical protein
MLDAAVIILLYDELIRIPDVVVDNETLDPPPSVLKLSTPLLVEEYIVNVDDPMLDAAITGTVIVELIRIPDVVVDKETYEPAPSVLKFNTPLLVDE